MRTSPSLMRRSLRAASVLVVLAVVACGGGDEPTGDPTTTAPTTDAATTAGRSSTTTEGPGDEAVPGDGESELTDEQAAAQVQALMSSYRAALIDAAAGGSLDERFQAALNGVFSGAQVDREVQGLESRGGAAALTTDPAPLDVGPVTVTSTAEGCAAGTAEIEGIDGLFTFDLGVVQPYYFRMVPAADGASSPGWRITFLAFSNNGLPLEQATCD